MVVPIGVCVVLPVMIVWIIMKAAMNADNKRAQVLLAALNSGQNIDADKLVAAMDKHKTPRERLHKRLLNGCIFSAIGLLTAITVTVLWCVDDITDPEELQGPLIIAAVLLGVGVGYLVTYFLTRKSIEDNSENCNEPR